MLQIICNLQCNLQKKTQKLLRKQFFLQQLMMYQCIRSDVSLVCADNGYTWTTKISSDMCCTGTNSVGLVQI